MAAGCTCPASEDERLAVFNLMLGRLLFLLCVVFVMYAILYLHGCTP